MSELIRRVGEAIHAALTAADFEASHMTETQLKAAARAAIDAMREPTEAMYEAGSFYSSSPQRTWAAMIDEAKIDA